jgi:NADPH:quinone reductase-like Zn-dependent oxidoreductase
LRNLAVFTKAAVVGQPFQSTGIEGIEVRSAIVETDAPDFDRADEPHNVLVRVKAFSCNYRDKALTLRAATSELDGFYVLGSEFVGEVLAVGVGVTDLRPGDRVIGNNAYPDSGVEGVVAGVPTNHASREIQVLHRVKLARIPDTMPDDVAAGFSIGGQTTYSMVRRIAVKAGDPVLVTAAKSNTSLFAIAALRRVNADIYALSTSGRFADRLTGLGISALIVVDPVREQLADNPAIRAIAGRTGGFAGVIDPYADLYLPHMPAIMAMGGRYTTCGFYNQYLAMVGKEAPQPPVPIGAALGLVMIKNLSIIGNCIGSADDLERALADYQAGLLPVAVDSQFRGAESGAFLDRTYNAADRFGKVIYIWD